MNESTALNHDHRSRRQFLPAVGAALAVVAAMAGLAIATTMADEVDKPPGVLAARDHTQPPVPTAPARQFALHTLPPLGFDEFLVLKRRRGQDGLPVNHMCNAGIPKDGYDNELAIFSLIPFKGKLRTLFRPADSSDFDATRKVVRGGSFHDRPFRATACVRWGYPTWQRVWNVGLRVVCEDVLDEANGPRRGKGAAETSDTK